MSLRVCALHTPVERVILQSSTLMENPTPLNIVTVTVIKLFFNRELELMFNNQRGEPRP